MLGCTLTTLALALIPPTALVRADASAGDKDLTGEWDLVALVRDGKEIPAPGEGECVLTCTGDTAIIKTGGKLHMCAMTVDADKKPKNMDLAAQNGDDKGKTYLGIYEIKGDDLRVCNAEAGKDRPTEFSPKEGWTLATYKRAKPKVRDEDLDGEWEFVTVTNEGTELPRAERKWRLRIKGDLLTAEGQDAGHPSTATLDVDADATPKVLDLTPGDGPRKGQVHRGIYEVKGDELRICQADPGHERPTEFSSKEDSGWHYAILKRIKK